MESEVSAYKLLDQIVIQNIFESKRDIQHFMYELHNLFWSSWHLYKNNYYQNLIFVSREKLLIIEFDKTSIEIKQKGNHFKLRSIDKNKQSKFIKGGFKEIFEKWITLRCLDNIEKMVNIFVATVLTTSTLNKGLFTEIYG